MNRSVTAREVIAYIGAHIVGMVIGYASNAYVFDFLHNKQGLAFGPALTAAFFAWGVILMLCVMVLFFVLRKVTEN